jgi:uncharacterized membrane protein (DUF485 family)
MFISIGFYLWICKRMDSYVNNNWRLFSPRAKEQTRYLWICRITVWLLYLGLIALLGFSGYWWAKSTV